MGEITVHSRNVDMRENNNSQFKIITRKKSFFFFFRNVIRWLIVLIVLFVKVLSTEHRLAAPFPLYRRKMRRALIFMLILTTTVEVMKIRQWTRALGKGGRWLENTLVVPEQWMRFKYIWETSWKVKIDRPLQCYHLISVEGVSKLRKERQAFS